MSLSSRYHREMRGGTACACILAACSFTHGQTAGGSSDLSCFDPSTAYAFCVATPTQPITLSTPVGGPFFDTGTTGMHDGCGLGVYTMVGSAEACVIAGTKVTVAAASSFTAVDAYPLVIASTGDVDIAGLLDVSTRDGGQHGAGNNPTECDDTGLDGTSHTYGAAGGAGGSFGTQGGMGGDGADTARGGTAQPPAPSLDGLRGGCRSGGGGNGSGGAPSAPGGNPGFGGGAVLVAAYGTISVGGAIDASGECGYAGRTQGGGGAGGSGGASGGMIVLSASSYTIAGTLVANGGGGGGGGGEDGNEGSADMGGLDSASAPSTAANGGASAGEGGSGGTGAATNVADVNEAMDGLPSTSNGGGGGGGGGEGVIGYIGGSFPAASDRVSPQAISL